MSNTVTRYVITHQANGVRRLTLPMQGRETYTTAAEAQQFLEAIRLGGIDRVIGEGAVKSLEVRPVPCYPGHFDPMTMWFEYNLYWLECYFTTAAGLPGAQS